MLGVPKDWVIVGNGSDDVLNILIRACAEGRDRIRGRKINLKNDPPPDLVVEVDITSPSSRRFLIYRDLV